ncbi:hypothetical protein [Rhodococcus tibetensis]|uniref:Uncharacterized protein n=1 Tax=Rhodococcus tibetensis TaxID=2965064 RepID=A0ABT1QE08_9NOCA|nr:hypothetical protein [Rhodococcus sp. FXJ9.536]MCQ4119970.1 hypothetical protein [Rhodococcus sp. FXJ9.536]
MKVREFDRYAVTPDFDPAEGSLQVLTAGDDRPVKGEFSYWGSDLVVLYRENMQLRLWVRGHDYLVDTLHVTWERSKTGQSTVSVTAHDFKRTWEYNPEPAGVMPRSEATWGDEEDFDFGLFVRNLVIEPGRRNALFTTRPEK